MDSGVGPVVLAIETATRRASVALVDQTGAPIEVVDLDDASAGLATAVARLLERHGTARGGADVGTARGRADVGTARGRADVGTARGRADVGTPWLAGYAIDLGPGSFTGLRVGIAFLKGLARARPAPVVAVGALEVLAADLLAHGPEALAVLRASGGQVFAGLFRPGGEGSPVPDPGLPVGLHRPEAALDRLRALGAGGATVEPDASFAARPVRVAGGDALDLLRPGLDALARPVPEVVVPRAETLGRLAAPRLARGEGGPASRLEPAYHQPSAAEAKRARRD